MNNLFNTTPGSSDHGNCSMAYWQWNPLAYFDPNCSNNPAVIDSYNAPYVNFPNPRAPSTLDQLQGNWTPDQANEGLWNELTLSQLPITTNYAGGTDIRAPMVAVDEALNPPKTNWWVAGLIGFGILLALKNYNKL